MKPHPLDGYHLHILPPTNKGELWFGYATHDDHPGLADQTNVRGATVGECGKNLEAVLRCLRGDPKQFVKRWVAAGLPAPSVIVNY